MQINLRLLFLVIAIFTTASVTAAVPGRAEVKNVTGTATVTSARGATTPLLKGVVLGQGDTISTTAGSSAVLDLDLNGDALVVDADTTVTLAVLEIVHIANRTVNTRLHVTKGRIAGDVRRKLSAASKYEMTDGKATGQVTGTKYVFKADGTIIVTEGTVRFTYIPAGQTAAVYVNVTAGHKFTPGSAAPQHTTTNEIKVVAALIGLGAASFYGGYGRDLMMVQISNPLTTSVSSVD